MHDRGVSVVLAELAGRIAAEAPKGWKRVQLRAFALGDGASGHRGFRFEPNELNQYGANDIDVAGSLCELHTLLAAEDHLMIELELEARGRFRAVLSERLDRADDRGFRYVLDHASEPPQQDLLLGGPDAAESGDPAHVVALYNEYRKRLRALLPEQTDDEAPPALPRWRREEIQEGLGVALPRDLLALYKVADGGGGHGTLHGFAWFGMEMLAALADRERWWPVRGWRRYVDHPSVTAFGPPAAIRRVADHPAWIPFAADGLGDYLAVDMAPGPNGRPGQVILIGRHQSEGPAYVAESVTALIAAHVDALASDRIQRDEDGGLWINSGDPRHHIRQYDELCSLDVAGRDAAPVRGIRPETVELSVRDAPWVDLSPVRGSSLRKFSIRNCAGLDLSPLQETPIEALDLATDTIDLAALQYHPTVSQVALRTAKPVDLRPLVSCPNLHALDLADAPAADLSALNELTGLRYLRMLRAQWPHYRPASLAVAELAEEPLQERKYYWSFNKAYEKPRPTLDDALDWVGDLTGTTGDILTVRGKFTA